jgi:hypothetical protein
MALVLILSVIVIAQTPDSTYDRGALRLTSGPGSTGIVQGIQARPVGGGTFVPGVDLLATANDSIRRHYYASRAANKRYAVLGGVFIGASLATMLYYGNLHDDWKPGWGVGLPAFTIAVGWAGAANASGGEDHLRRAIWLYNRDLPRDAAAGRDCPYDRCALRVQPRASSARLVQGMNDAPIGPLEAHSTLFAAAGDSARMHYEAFRRFTKSTRTARRIGLGAYLGAATLFVAGGRNKWSRGFGYAFLVLGYAAGHGSVYGQAHAQSELDEAIWHYNRTLPE